MNVGKVMVGGVPGASPANSKTRMPARGGGAMFSDSPSAHARI